MWGNLACIIIRKISKFWGESESDFAKSLRLNSEMTYIKKKVGTCDRVRSGMMLREIGFQRAVKGFDEYMMILIKFCLWRLDSFENQIVLNIDSEKLASDLVNIIFLAWHFLFWHETNQLYFLLWFIDIWRKFVHDQPLLTKLLNGGLELRGSCIDGDDLLKVF